MKIESKDRISPLEVAEARSKGFAFVCAMCTKLHAVPWRISSNCGVEDCGGPMSGKDFPRYIGDLEGNFVNWCFVCGQKNPEHAIKINGSKRYIGVCKKHLKMLTVDRAKYVQKRSTGMFVNMPHSNIITVGD